MWQDQLLIMHLVSNLNHSLRHEYQGTWYDLRPDTCLNLTYSFMIGLKLQFLDNVSWEFMNFINLTVSLWMWDLDLFIFHHNSHHFCQDIIYPYKPHFLMLSICTQRTHLAAHGYIRKQLQMAYRAYVRNDTKIVVLFGQWIYVLYISSNNQAYLSQIHLHDILDHLMDFTIASPCTHTLLHILVFVTYGTTFCILHLYEVLCRRQ